ncbi:MAG: type IV secretion protein IcmG [Tatlockia sp.]|nr:type IV secretion protein IcmG [Tatlockia sp.]
MADKEYDDEYQFDDLDTMDSKSLDERDDSLENSPLNQNPPARTNVRRNALIVVVVVALLMLGYKFFGSFFSSKPKPTQAIPSLPVTTVPQPLTTVAQVPQPSPPPVQPTTQVVPQVPPPNTDNTEINQKLSSLEASQQDVKLDVNSVNTKVSGITTNISDLSEKITILNRMITDLTAKLEQQSHELTLLTERAKPTKPVRRIKVKVVPRINYFIQAIIPGRAWLIRSNGSTLTVREGTRLTGYGVVKLIDPIQGRVLTSSGRVILFSKQDS